MITLDEHDFQMMQRLMRSDFGEWLADFAQDQATSLAEDSVYREDSQMYRTQGAAIAMTALAKHLRKAAGQ